MPGFWIGTLLPQHGLANLDLPVRNRFCETLEMGAGKSSVRCAFNSHSHRGDYIACGRSCVRVVRAYWAAIATLVVMQSTLSATLLISVERIAATALGAVTGALLASYFTGNPLLFAAAVFVLGLLCAAFRMEKSAHRYASVTLAIIMLIPRSNAAWIVAVHRFFEVSVGILVALAVTAVWTERQPKSANQSSE